MNKMGWLKSALISYSMTADSIAQDSINLQSQECPKSPSQVVRTRVCSGKKVQVGEAEPANRRWRGVHSWEALFTSEFKHVRARQGGEVVVVLALVLHRVAPIAGLDDDFVAGEDDDRHWQRADGGGRRNGPGPGHRTEGRREGRRHEEWRSNCPIAVKADRPAARSLARSPKPPC